MQTYDQEKKTSGLFFFTLVKKNSECLMSFCNIVGCYLCFVVNNRSKNNNLNCYFFFTFFKVVSFRVKKTLSRIPKADRVYLNFFVFNLIIYLSFFGLRN